MTERVPTIGAAASMAGVQAPSDARGLTASIEELERQIRLLRGRQNDPPAELAAEYGRLETQWLRLSAAVARVEPGAGSAGHAVLAEAEDWSHTAADLDLPDAVRNGRELVRDCAVDEVAALKESLARLVGKPELGKLFAGLMQITTLELEFGSHLEAANGDNGNGSDAAETPKAASAFNDLTELREQLRTAFSAALGVHAPEDEQREAWRAELADRCDTLLTSIDDISPERAATQLLRVADDVEWHVRHVETSGGAARRRLRRKARRLRAEWSERVLQHRLEGRFGRPAVARFERYILVLIFLVLGLLTFEMAVVDHTNASWARTIFWLTVTDTAICAVFLWEFFVKLWMVPGRGQWFARHFLIDFVPSLPLGLLTLPQFNSVRYGRALRLLRLSRLVRYVRILRPAIRLCRAFGFLCRGMDRLVTRYRRLLNRTVILYPTRAERLQARQNERSLLPRLRRVKKELHTHWESLLARADGPDQEAVAVARLDAWRQARSQGLTRRGPQDEPHWTEFHDIPLDMLLRRLSSLTPQDVEHDLDEDLTTRLARIVRTFARRPICWFPIIRSLVPKISARMTDAELVSAGAQSAAARLKLEYDRWLWTSDLHGTVTPSQVIDRLGSIMMRGAIRPVAKLVGFGLLFGMVQLAISFTPDESLTWLKGMLNQFLGPTLMVLGCVCLVVLSIGWWLRRIARRATEYYERAAHAQFLPLTEIIRCRHLDNAAELLYDRVLAPERRLHDPLADQRRDELLEIFRKRVRQSLMGDVSGESTSTFPMLDRVVLLYRDSLDGAPLVDSDVRTTTQLLGNPSIRQIVELSDRVAKKDEKQMETLDLDRQKSLLGGPYLWFNFIARSIAHSVACNLVDYNRHAIPLEELPLSADAERERYEAWLRAGAEGRDPKPVVEEDTRCVTTAFTALHFLDYDPQRDHEVLLRFGPDVLERLRRDRSLIVRRVFGTFPWHQLSRERRVLNLYVLYMTWLSGGRALLVPVFLLGRLLKLAWAGVCWVRDAVREILHPDRDYSGAAEADFVTASRKIERMRGPIVLETMRLRSKIDAEYLGVPIPGEEAARLADANLDADLKFLEAEPWLVQEMQRKRVRAEADMRRLEKLIDDGLLGRVAEHLGVPADALSTSEHIRASAVAYLGDYRGVRRLLSAAEILDDVYSMAPLEHLVAPFPWPRWLLRCRFRRYWKAHGFGDRDDREAAWRATVHNIGGVAGALKTWAKHGHEARAEGERILGDLLRHPSRISEQVVTLRAVQTFALLDIFHYRDHVYELGRYAELGDDPGELLTWGRVQEG